MNRLQAEKWLSQALDNELSPRRQARLEAYLAAHPDMQDLRARWQEVGAALRQQQQPLPQTPAAAWADVQRAIRLRAANDAAQPVRWRGLGGTRFAGALAATVLLITGVWYTLTDKQDIGSLRTIAEADRTEVEWVETDLPGAMSMVYEDADTGLTVIWVLVEEGSKESEHAS
jgi:anti-sigma factor RsiW